MPSGFKRLLARITHDRSIGFGLEHLGLATLRHPRLIALIVLAFSALCFTQIPRANVDGDLLRVYAHSGPYYDAYEHLSETFGTFENDVYVIVSSERLMDPDVMEQVRELAFELELGDFAVGTMSPFTLRRPVPGGGSMPAVPEGMMTADEVAMAMADLQQNDPLMRNLITPDLTGVVIIMFPNREVVRERGAHAMIEDLRRTLSPHQSDTLSIDITGPPVWTTEMLSATVNDQVKFTLYGFALGALIALVALRSVFGALIVAATPFIAVMWTMGMILMLFGSFTFLTVIVTTLVIVIAFAESMFFTFNWLAYWRDGMEPNKAVDATIKLVGPATALTMLVSLVSFACLSLTPGQGVREFSAAGAIGSFLLFICTMTFQPLLLKLVLRLGFKAPPRTSPILTAPLPLSWFLASRFGRPLAIFAFVATALLLIPYFLIQPRFDFEDFLTRNSTALTAAESIDQGVGGVAPLYVRVPLIEDNPDIGPVDYARVELVHRILEGELGENKAISIASMASYTEAGFSMDEVLDSVGPFMRQRFVTNDGSQALVTGFMPTVMPSGELKALVGRLEAELDAAGLPDAELGGFNILTTFANDDIVRSLQGDLTVSVFVNLFLIGFAFQSFRVAAAASIPNLLPILGTEAWLWWSGMGLQLSTVIALTIAFGIAVDDTVHFLSHYLHGRREEGRSHEDAIRHTLLRIGGAIVATTIILCAGTAILVFSELPQVAMFGSLFVLTLALAVLGDLFILPALLMAGGKFFHPLGRIRVRTADHVPTPDDPAGDTVTR